MWAVTVIGAPKKAAAQTIEALEKDARGWYGGAVGMISLNGDINTGILIRTTYLRDGMARYPVGATLLYDSVPAMEERETRLKATGFFRTLGAAPATVPDAAERTAAGARARSCCWWITTTASSTRWPTTRGRPAREVVTYRAGFPPELIAQVAPDLILISPGPGPPGGFRRAGPGEDRGAAGRAGVRRVPGIAGHCGGVRRRTGRARLPHARQAFDGAASRRRAFSRACPRSFRWAATTRCSRAARRSRRAWKSRRKPKTA